MSKIIDALKGLTLYWNYKKTIDPRQLFKGKRVALIGPADSAHQKEKQQYIDGFDFVVRVNKAPHAWTEEKAKFIGRRTDIWFHSFFENTKSGGGPLDMDLAKKLGVRFLINPRTSFEARRRTFNFYRKYLIEQPVYHLPKNFYDELSEKFGELLPTIGFTALYSGLCSECEAFYISGFTFFKTPYAKGYRDHLADMEANKKHIKAQGLHDPDLEYALFLNFLEKTACHNVKLDEQLQNIVDQTYKSQQ